ncbi:MAG TPA: tetratricopeptide repeat protein [Bryobacteraceae bacterium]|nr:tetratricopeptide repeat protein [Bryobacteraceae bacterium]
MNWQRSIISAVTTLSFGFLLITSNTFGQDPNQGQIPFPNRPLSGDPFDAVLQGSGYPEAPAWSGPLSEIEKAQQQMQRDSVPSFVPEAGRPAPEVGGSDAVSVAQLRHPLTGKGLKLIKKVESYLKLGQRAKANEQLVEAFKVPSAAPYAHAILGTEYLQDGRPGAAVPELEDAARVLPLASVHSNLGYALCLTGHAERGREELKQALRLDGDSAPARFLLGVALLNEKSQHKEAEYNLNLAQKKVAPAHLALAVCRLRDGDKDAAEKHVREFLGPNQDLYFNVVWNWATAAAANSHPARAFGFRDADSD